MRSCAPVLALVAGLLMGAPARAEKFDVGSPKPCETDADCFDSQFGSWCDPQFMQCGRCSQDRQCAGEDEICDAGACVVPCADAMDCPPDQPLCDPSFEICVECVQRADCPADEYCGNNGNCAPDICVQGDTHCIGTDEIFVCSEDGSDFVADRTCPDAMVCPAGAAEAECVDASESTTTDAETGDSGETGDSAPPPDTTGESAPPQDALGRGCACTTGSSFVPWWLLFLPLMGRRPSSRRPRPDEVALR